MRSLLLALALLSAPVLAQPKSPPPAPPSFFQQYAETHRFNNGRPMMTRITPDERTVYFLRAQPPSRARTLFAFDVATGETREVLTPEKLLKGAGEPSTPEQKARRERMKAAGISSYELMADGTKLFVSMAGSLYVVERATGKVTELKAGPGAISPRLSPDGRHLAYVREHDLYRLDLATQTEHRLTRGGTRQRTHGLADYFAMEELARFTGYWWSPDGKSLAYVEVDTSGVETLSVADVMHPERGADAFPYPRPGTPHAKLRLGIIPVTGGRTTWVDWDSAKYPHLSRVTWSDKSPLTLRVQDQRQQEEVLLAVDARTGKTRVLLTEKDDAWLNPHPSFPEWLPDGSGFLWETERNGASEVELRNADGSLARSLVKPGAGFWDLARYLPEQDTLYFLGGPVPPERYLWRVVKGGPPTRVTAGGPAMELANVSRAGGLMVVSSEGPTSMPRAHVLRADGTRMGVLPSVAVEPPLQPRFEVRQVGQERFWVSVVRPRDFKPGVKLPVIVEVYGGSFTTTVFQSMAYHLRLQWIADQGFLVVTIDGRGTPLRGRAWQRTQKHDFWGQTLEDQVAALRALAAELPEVDLQRVGITGASHGGYLSAMAAMVRPDVFKAAAAVSSVADWRDYSSHVPERHLGLLQEKPEVYERNSLLTYAKEDKPLAKLLLIHGTADDNVHFSHTLKLSDALFRAGRPHELLLLAGSGHGVSDPLVSERMWERVIRHFRESL
ncbi:DPP IV N-terminal domain-containing protein [Myxococcus sp. RHSTA-1-4]|uniref:DPP IV N-terminal domain-containing protein n=1 Tax=Myxococcus sp. RHSTA-1-4 TaxID=2874601 RepID=UPI001CBC8A1E|nr:DPP IV N-terminal domain-containing protein [Myxococcus sp. RHSTA-1-4]MBZ4420423.1 S9 family peptidase [Myxococcus sp. RHSTA-1-4]